MTATLEFILGRGGSGKTHACLQDMRERMEQDPMGPALIVLLPEHMTFKVERRLASSVPQGRGFLRSYVFGFRRFARQVLLETGGAVLPRISEIGRRLLLRHILTARANDLTVFGRAAKQHGFGENLSEAIQEAKSYGFTPELMTETAEKLGKGNAQLAGKLHDIALLAEDFQKALAGRANDAEDMLETLAARIPEAALLENAEVWVDGFVFFNPQEQRILTALLQKVKAVHVTFAMDPDAGSCENKNESGLFHRSCQTMEDLEELADRLGIQPKRRYLSLGDLSRFRAPALRHIERALFRFPQVPQEDAGGLRIVEAANARLEVGVMAADILRLCREQGYRWRDIGVLVRDADTYADILRLTLPDYGIPYFMDSKRESLHHPLSELLRSVFEALRGWRPEPMFRCLRTEFWPELTVENIDLLENYVRAFGIRGKKTWTQEEDWAWHDTYALENDEELSDKQKAELTAINLWRRQVAGPLEMLDAALSEAETVRAMTQAVYDFLLALDVPARLDERAAVEAKKEEKGETSLALAAEDRQIWNGIIDLLDQFVTVIGDDKMSRREYASVLEDGLDALQLSLVPPGVDAVTIASFDQNSLDNVRAIYILGANEGVMPRKIHESGLLSDADRLHLQDLGVKISSGGLERSYGESYLLYRGFTEARDYLWVSFALSDAAGKENLPSAFVDRLHRILPKAETITVPIETIERADDLLLSAPRPALSGLTAALRGERDQGHMPAFWRDVYNWFLEKGSDRNVLQLSLNGLFDKPREESLPPRLALDLFARKKRMKGSVSRFEGYRQCPFQHFAKYGLALKERKDYEFQLPDLGVLLHSVLRGFGEELREQGKRWAEVGDGECAEMCQRLMQELAPKLRGQLMMKTETNQHLLTRIRRTAERSIHRLIAYDKASQFHPVLFEQSFGMGDGSLPPLTYDVDGVQVEIRGQIDRIDATGDGRYFLVMDYKTGKAAINLIDIYYGIHIQLLVYMLVAKSLQEGSTPAGVLYCFLKDIVLDPVQKMTAEQAEEAVLEKLQMPGWVLADKEVYEALDASGKFFPITYTPKGSLSAKARKHLKSKEEFDLLLDYVGYLIRDTSRRILQGDMRARPYRASDWNACNICPYHDLCGFDPTMGDEYEVVDKKMKDEEILQAMQECTGTKEEP